MSQNPNKVYIQQGREKSLERRHPWIFSGALQDKSQNVKSGLVQVCDAFGKARAVGYLNSASEIRVRVFSWEPSAIVNQEFWQQRIGAALELRGALGYTNQQQGAYRLCHSESDLTPGLIIDVYGDWAVVQLLSAAAEAFENEIVTALGQTISLKGIYLRNDAEGRNKEGQIERNALLWGAEPPEQLEIVEHGLKFMVDVKRGQKTGFYLDQRQNRHALQRFAADKRVLNVFCFSGGFSVHAAAAGATSVLSLDSSAESLELCRRNMALNSFEREADEYCLGDAFEVLRQYRDRNREFDVIVLDPPKFAHNRSQVEKAARAYKDINLLALKLLKPGGVLFTFSCSGAISQDLFQKIIFGASVDAGVEVQIIEHMHQGADHPILLSFPEGEYLKGLICKKL